ncbi:HD-GYP domain-containing protein [Azospirillum griseum]|uniref:Response regulator n=1 Tax=Azospirillum griseum TaxID=2496639 RepID=A0A3S0KX82_9PROT|nr:HD domain-containing phosphohydrolase [Azospirillum griseum]RTR18607.1 response regulator [Azospirillum griseum]
MKVAVVDDSDSSLSLMSGLVAALDNVEAVPFSRATDALIWIGQNPVDLVIVDYLMPSLNGLGFIELFRRDPKQASIPVIMVTSSESKDVRYMALQLGATDFLTKPIDPVEFTARVNNTLEAHRAHKAMADQSAWLASEVARATERLLDREREALLVLGRTAEHRDPETGRHLTRMSHYSWLIALALGLPTDQAARIKVASPLHDVGKVAIPDHILLKPGKLTPDEFAIMKGHAQHGANILAGSQSPLLQLACEIALSHHEWFDGSGYPNGLSGDAIPLSGRIVAVADVFDALTTTRPYKTPWSFEDAHDHLRTGAGCHFDPVCVTAFGSVLSDIRDVFEANRE